MEIASVTAVLRSRESRKGHLKKIFLEITRHLVPQGSCPCGHLDFCLRPSISRSSEHKATWRGNDFPSKDLLRALDRSASVPSRLALPA